MSVSENAIFVDGNHQLHRCWRTTGSFSAIPEKRVPLMVLHYFAAYALEKRAKFGSLCFDGDDIFRYRIDPNYKIGRRTEGTGGGMDHTGPRGEGGGKTALEIKDEVYKCLQPTIRLFDLLGIPCHQNSELEADDLMASGAYSFTRNGDSRIYIPGRKAWIVTPDKDAFQRVDKQVRVYRPEINKQPSIEWDVDRVVAEKGMKPRQFCDYQALVGDKVDDIPPILSPKKAERLILKYGSLSKLLASEEGQEIWLKHQNEIRRNVQLVRLSYKSWAPTLEELRFFRKKPDRKRVVDEYGKLPDSYLAFEMTCTKKGLF